MNQLKMLSMTNPESLSKDRSFCLALAAYSLFAYSGYQNKAC